LAIRCAWSISSLVVLGGHLTPVGRKNGTSRCLIALHHGSPGVLISSLIDLLEKTIESSITLRLFLLELLVNILTNFVPIFVAGIRFGLDLGFGFSHINNSLSLESGTSIWDEGKPVLLINCFLQLNLKLLRKWKSLAVLWSDLV
jgi:hypothetical protein